MADVFVSYKAEDRPRVAPLVKALEADGASVWWDAHIGAGDEWRETILRQLEAAKCVIVVWSKRSVGPNGQFVRDEAARALKRQTYLPLRIDRVDPPLGFGETQALDLAGWKGDRADARYQAVLAAARKRADFGGSTTATSLPVSRRGAVVGGGAVAAAAIVAAGGWYFIGGTPKRDGSIAVLPFANLSGDPGQAYFSDGIAEELRSALARIPGLKVVARTSSEAVRDEDAKTASRQLGVGNILTGSVRRSPQMIRITAQLIDGHEGIERWSDVYDRPPFDALQIQTDIANRVVDALSLRLGALERKRIEEGGTTNVDAHDLLLKADALNGDAGAEALQRSIALVDEAISLDPRYADAFALKAALLTRRAGTYSRTAGQYREGYALAEQAARRAIQLAPRSRAGYVALAEIFDQQLHRRAAFALLQRMSSLPGSDAKTLRTYAVFLSEIGRHSSALQAAEQSVSLDPLNPFAYGIKAMVLRNARRYADAMTAADKVLQLAPDAKPIKSFRGYCQAMLGNIEESRKEFEAEWGDVAEAPAGDLAPLVRHDPGLGERVLEQLSRTAGDGAYYQFAEIYAQLGKKDEAIRALEKAWTVKDPGLTTILVDPALDPIREDSRFKALFKRLDFPT